jgi:hypothetical protein
VRVRVKLTTNLYPMIPICPHCFSSKTVPRGHGVQIQVRLVLLPFLASRQPDPSRTHITRYNFFPSFSFTQNYKRSTVLRNFVLFHKTKKKQICPVSQKKIVYFHKIYSLCAKIRGARQNSGKHDDRILDRIMVECETGGGRI